jgi:hypothetical protein
VSIENWKSQKMAEIQKMKNGVMEGREREEEGKRREN